MKPAHLESPGAELFGEARTSILIIAWLGLVAFILLGLCFLSVGVICAIYLNGYVHTSLADTAAFFLYFKVAATCAYGAWTFLHLLRCGQNLGPDKDLGLALEQHRRFWIHGAILSFLMLAEALVYVAIWLYQAKS